ncbi:MAG: recombination regulator RecX [Treponemataceae bacterium]|nr:recombination regulator RecX [Treponemataceae bacterium]
MHDSFSSEKSQDELCITIDSLEQTPAGIVKITTPTGSIFLLREDYLENSLVQDYYPSRQFMSYEVLGLDLIESTLCCAVENAALNYLDRSEHSRFLLEQKLRNKKFGKNQIAKALDYLEGKNLLSDSRYALSWLRTRRLSVSEGRTKLFAGLAERGVSRKTAQEALDEFFEEFPEEDLLDKAMSKLQKTGCSEEKLFEKLMKKGFSASMIRKKLQN